MTPELFKLLSPTEQEEFLSGGGKIDFKQVGEGSEVRASEEPGVSHVSPGTEDAPSVVEASLPSAHQPAPFTLPDPVKGFDIKDPVELLFLLDDEIASGAVQLHDWQIKFMLDFADERHTKDFSFKAEVRASNGSGKDKYIVASCVVWLCMAYRMSRGVVTNGSGVQLDNQTETYIRHLCQRANSKFGSDIWKTTYRFYECLPTNSPITLFATDEPNKAEGYHPLVPGAKMAIFASEAKAIPDEIFTALNRCTGFTHRVDVSTPGLQLGVFHDRCMGAVDRKVIKDIKEVGVTDCIQYHITAYDCPHITQAEIDQLAEDMPGGKTGSAFRSAVDAEFGTTDEMVVLSSTYVAKACDPKRQVKWIQEPFNKAGLDLSDGGDETVLTIRNGNKHLKTIPFKFDNTQDTIAFLDEQFRENDLDHPESFIFGDCGGLGKPMLDQLKKMGWTNIRYVDNRSKARYPKTYLNRGAELWFHFRKLLEKNELILISEKLLRKQLCGRYYKIMPTGVHRLLSKLEQKSEGYPSPDRADSMVLAFWDYKSTVSETGSTEDVEDRKPFETPDIEEKPRPVFTIKEWASRTSDDAFKMGYGYKKHRDTSHLEKELERYNRQLVNKN